MDRCYNFSATVFLLIITVFCLAPFPVNAQNSDRILAGDFSSGELGKDLPDGWEPFTFDKIPNHTQYKTIKEEDQVVIKAQSRASASGLIRRIEIDPREYPMLEWRWKVGGVLKKGDARLKAGDDYAARIYIAFSYDPSLLSFVERMKYRTIKLLRGEYPPAALINYIWANKIAVNTMIPNAYTNRCMMIAVQSGEQRVGQWIQEERNILLDFREAFNAEPPMITGVAIMTDSDNTGESVTAWYGDIVFRKK
jgi:hypothetical protein